MQFLDIIVIVMDLIQKEPQIAALISINLNYFFMIFINLTLVDDFIFNTKTPESKSVTFNALS